MASRWSKRPPKRPAGDVHAAREDSKRSSRKAGRGQTHVLSLDAWQSWTCFSSAFRRPETAQEQPNIARQASWMGSTALEAPKRAPRRPKRPPRRPTWPPRRPRGQEGSKSVQRGPQDGFRR
eukprot:5674376-Pyramimonas_sp.AAC.1